MKNISKKMVEERTKFRIYCDCGHSMVLFPFEHRNKKICSYCGKYVYKNEKEKFKEKLGVKI